MKRQTPKLIIITIFAIFSIFCSTKCKKERIEVHPSNSAKCNDEELCIKDKERCSKDESLRIKLRQEISAKRELERIEVYHFKPMALEHFHGEVNSEQYKDQEMIPSFPWPPPKASAMKNLEPNLLKNPICLGNVDTCLSNALEAAGYVEKSYFFIPGGFALVTRLEQINDDGKPKGLPDRWSVNVAPLKKFNLSSYLKALFTSNAGYFRIIVFIITPYPFTQAKEGALLDGALGWLNSGANKLPPAISECKFSEEYTVSALIYEFEKPKSGEAVPLVPGRLTCKAHLLNSGILNSLAR